MFATSSSLLNVYNFAAGTLHSCENVFGCPFPGDDCMVVPGSIDMTIDPESGCPVIECGEYVCSECSTDEECGSMEVCRYVRSKGSYWLG